MNKPFDVGVWVKNDKREVGYVVTTGMYCCFIHIPGKHKIHNFSVESQQELYTSLTACEEVSKEAREAFVNWALDERRFDLLEG